MALIDKYRRDGRPDGQVAAFKPSQKLGGQVLAWCVENFDGKGVQFNDYLFR